MKQGLIFALLATAVTVSSLPVVSNVRGRVLSCDSSGGRFYRSTIEATFDLSGADSVPCRIFPGCRMLESNRLLTDEGFFFQFKNLSGDTAVLTGVNYRVNFTVRDTCGYDSVRVKITAWDRQGWPPFQNRPMFERHHGLNLDIRNGPVHRNSANFMRFLDSMSRIGGTCSQYNFRVGSMTHGVFRAMGDHPKKRLVACGRYCYYPDTLYPAPFPSLSLGDPSEPPMSDCTGDCHLAIVDVENMMDYEFFVANKLSSGPQDWEGSPAVYNMLQDTFRMKSTTNYTPYGLSPIYSYRGTYNGANVSGVPFSLWALKVEDFLDGEIQHVMGFNWWYQANYQVYPACHGGADYAQLPNWVPIGLRIRLKAGFDIDAKIAAVTDPKAKQALRIMLRCFQKYGIMNAQTAGCDHSFHLLSTNLPGSSFDDQVAPNFSSILRGLNLSLANDFEVVDWTWQAKQYENFPKGP